MSAESLDVAVEYAVAEGRRASVELRQLINDAIRELEAATGRLGPFRRAQAGVDEATGDENAIILMCVGCGRTS
jgi:hypothetical protein